MSDLSCLLSTRLGVLMDLGVFEHGTAVARYISPKVLVMSPYTIGTSRKLYLSPKKVPLLMTFKVVSQYSFSQEA